MAMKELFTTALLGFIATVFATASYAFNPPSQSSMEGQPLYYPCSIKMTPLDKPGEGHISCQWIGERQIELYSEESRQLYKTFNHVIFNCSNRGFCVGTGLNQGYEVGSYHAGDRGSINVWFYLDQSVEGKPMAYRWDQGPKANKPRVEYVEAGKYIHEYFLNYGANDAWIKHRMDLIYDTGLDGFLSDISGSAPVSQTIGEVESAWCNPRMDDDCYINDIQVPMEQLKNYLKVLDVEAVEAAGGYCEYPVCYDVNDKVIGIRS